MKLLALKYFLLLLFIIAFYLYYVPAYVPIATNHQGLGAGVCGSRRNTASGKVLKAANNSTVFQALLQGRLTIVLRGHETREAP